MKRQVRGAFSTLRVFSAVQGSDRTSGDKSKIAEVAENGRRDQGESSQLQLHFIRRLESQRLIERPAILAGVQEY